MSQQDRYYDRGSQSIGVNPIAWLFGGSVSLFSISGIRVRLHCSLAIFVVSVLLLGGGANFTLEHRLFAVAALFTLVLIHEFARAAAARWVGGYADEVVLWPLGGLSEPQSPRRPMARLLTIVAGPLAIAVIGGVAAGALFLTQNMVVPLAPEDVFIPSAWSVSDPAFYLWYTYAISYVLLLVNLLPILPLDGGHALQAVLWPVLGYGRALLAACGVGVYASLFVAIYGIGTGYWLLSIGMLGCLIHCAQRRTAMKAAGVETFDHYEHDVRRPRRVRLSRFTKWRVRRQIRHESNDQVRLDEILAKVHREGMRSLSWRERGVLRRATYRQRQQSVEVES